MASHAPPAKTAATPALTPIFCHVFMGLQLWSSVPSNFLRWPPSILTHGKLQKFPGGPSKRACLKVFAGEAGILLAREGACVGPHSTWNFTVISVRKKVICLFSIIGS